MDDRHFPKNALPAPAPNKTDPKLSLPKAEAKPAPAQQPARAAQASEPVKAPSQTPVYKLSADYASIVRRETQNSQYNSEIPNKLVAASNKYGVDPQIIFAIVHKESNGRHYITNQDKRRGEDIGRSDIRVINNVSKNGKYLNKDGSRDIGVMQINTIHTVGKYRRITLNELLDVDKNINYGVKYYSELEQRYHGDAALAVVAYGMGPGGVDAWLRGEGQLSSDMRNRVKEFFGIELPQDGRQYKRGKYSYAGGSGSSSYPASEAESEIGPVQISKLCIKEGALEFAPPEKEQKYKAKEEPCVTILQTVATLAFRKHIYA